MPSTFFYIAGQEDRDEDEWKYWKDTALFNIEDDLLIDDTEEIDYE
jgi:hypothetical protein